MGIREKAKQYIPISIGTIYTIYFYTFLMNISLNHSQI